MASSNIWVFLVQKSELTTGLKGREDRTTPVIGDNYSGHSNQQIWKTQQWPQDWKRSVFIPIPKTGNAKECSNFRKIALISHTSEAMFKILQARLQQYINCELPDVQAGFRKGRRKKEKKRQRNQRSNGQHPLDHQKSKRVPEKHLFLLHWLCQSLWLSVSQQTGKFWKRREYQTVLSASWDICMQVRKQQIELDI